MTYKIALVGAAAIFAFTPILSSAQMAPDVPQITKTLQAGMSGEEVTILQDFLRKLHAVYPEGLVTGYFGNLTRKAVMKFQTYMGIEPVGIVGPKTKRSLNSLLVAAASATGLANRATPATPATPYPGTGTAATPATPAVPGGEQGTQPGPADETPPIVSEVGVSAIGATKANIVWLTNEPATSAILLASSTGFLPTYIASSSPTLTTSHSLTVTGLMPSTRYSYIVSSQDAAGNTGTSGIEQFITATAPTTTSPTATTTPPTATPPTATTTPPTAPPPSGTTTPPLPSSWVNKLVLTSSDRTTGTGVPIASSGSGYGLLWWIDSAQNPGGLYFTAINSDGTQKPAGTTQVISGGGNVSTNLGPPVIIRNGSEFALFWNHFFARFDANGNRLQANTTLADISARTNPPDFKQNGSSYGLFWLQGLLEQGYVPHLAILNSQGTVTTKVRASDEARFSYTAHGASSGSQYAIAWSDPRSTKYEVYLARFSSAGVKTGGDTKVANCPSSFCVVDFVHWDGTNFAVIWRNTNLGIYKTNVSTEGVVGSTIQFSSITASGYDNLAWSATPGEYVVLNGYTLSRYDNSGNLIGQPKKITQDAIGITSNGQFVPIPGGFAAAWGWNTETNTRIYFGYGN